MKQVCRSNNTNMANWKKESSDTTAREHGAQPAGGEVRRCVVTRRSSITCRLDGPSHAAYKVSVTTERMTKINTKSEARCKKTFDNRTSWCLLGLFTDLAELWRLAGVSSREMRGIPQTRQHSSPRHPHIACGDIGGNPFRFPPDSTS
jgi:hypothetical protein